MNNLQRRVVGTAGHIDHGKTSLVRALTGVDCDRLPEEKQRGITIDLGFANLRIGDLQIGFVDVPGHERFVKNMLAGVGGIDAVLLVVAADESIKPQTREHLAICKLLGIQHGIIVLTKSDAVDTEIRELVAMEVRDLCAGSFLEHAPLVSVSSITGEGIEELKARLVEVLTAAPERDADARPLRLPVDRVFSLRGFGTVVTGTLVSGSIARDQQIEILPSGRTSRARSVEVHSQQRDSARAGERTSVNVADLSVENLSRGDQIVAPGSLRASSVLTVDLTLLADAPELKDQTRVRVHHFAAELLGTVRFLDAEKRVLRAGESVVAQIRLESPVAAAAHDRFVIRRYSPAITIGGGAILDAHLPRLSRNTRSDLFEVLRAGALSQRMEALGRMSGLGGITVRDLAQRFGLPEGTIAKHLRGGKSALVAASETTWLHRELVTNFRKTAMEALASYFKQNRVTVGMPKSEFVQKLLPPSADARVVEFLLEDLVREKIAVVGNDVVDVPGRSKQLGGVEGDLARMIEERYRSAGLQTPAVSELINTIQQKPKVIEGVISYLVKNGVLLRIAEGVYLHREVVEEAVQKMRTRSGETIDVGAFKEFFEISRKVAIPLLEHFDRSGVTKRQGDRRLVL